MHILIVSDCPKIRQVVTASLACDGFHIVEAKASIYGLQLLQQRKLDLLILDAALTEISAEELCRQLRRFLELPILVFAAHWSTVQDEIAVLEAGADDYLVRDPESQVLRARIKALLRRSRNTDKLESHLLYIDHLLSIDVDRAQVFQEGSLLSLSTYEFKLLALLIRNLDEVVTITEMIEELWPGECERKHEQCRGLVHTYIRRLRKKLEREAASPKYIVNEYGLGYRFTSLL